MEIGRGWIQGLLRQHFGFESPDGEGIPIQQRHGQIAGGEQDHGHKNQRPRQDAPSVIFFPSRKNYWAGKRSEFRQHQPAS